MILGDCVRAIPYKNANNSYTSTFNFCIIFLSLFSSRIIIIMIYFQVLQINNMFETILANSVIGQ